MKTSVKIETHQVDDSKNYAAIYARISSSNENNSINSQIEMAKDKLNEKGLLVYASYADHVSGRSTPPHKRKAFKKLLEDAKAGCFKNLIIYRLDRLVRSFNDWIEIKKTLADLNVNLLFSDSSQELPSNSPQTAFLQNLTVMVAEMEPANIYYRASNGRKFRRKEGAYSAGANIPFGYNRVTPNDLDAQKTAKSFYELNLTRISFIQYIFFKFKQQIEDQHVSLSKLRNTCADFLDILLDAINKDTFSTLKDSHIVNQSEYKLLDCIYCELKEKGKETVISDLLEAKNHLFVNKKNSSKGTEPLNRILKNPVYAGYMLCSSEDRLKKDEVAIDNLGIKKDALGNPYIYFNDFIKIKNLTPAIDLDTFEKVYSYLIAKDLLKIDTSPNFFLKKKIKCACGSKLLLNTDGLLHCGDSNCSAYIKTEVIELILSTIVDNVLNNSATGFSEFSTILTNKIKKSQTSANNLRLSKINLMKEYISDKKSCYLDEVYELTKNLTAEIKLCCEYRKQLSYITEIEALIFSYYNDSYVNPTTIDYIESMKAEIINYILSNENVFSPIFHQLIKEVKVVLINGQRNRQVRLQINYEFTPKRDSDILKSIN